jgi:hypothetical protein
LASEGVGSFNFFTWLKEPLQRFLDGEMKNIVRERKILENKRLGMKTQISVFRQGKKDPRKQEARYKNTLFKG